MSETGNVYQVENLTLKAESTLTVNAGVQIKMTYAASINVSNAKAKLVVAGSAAAPVLFTSYKDDSACGVGAANEPVCDTNGDGAATQPAKGDWGAIAFGRTAMRPARSSVQCYGMGATPPQNR